MRDLRLPEDPLLLFVFVDDGSSDGTESVLRRLARPQDTVLRLDVNQGKAEAVRLGMLFALENVCPATCQWIGFWDADFATPLSEAPLFLSFAATYPNPSAIWGSRVYRAGARIERNFKRHVFGRAFATFAKLVLGLETYDSQCGSKIFRRSKVLPAFGQPFISRWLFDIELYFRLERVGALIVEYPLQSWRDVSGGTIRISRLIFNVLRDVYRIWRFYT